MLSWLDHNDNSLLNKLAQSILVIDLSFFCQSIKDFLISSSMTCVLLFVFFRRLVDRFGGINFGTGGGDASAFCFCGNERDLYIIGS